MTYSNNTFTRARILTDALAETVDLSLVQSVPPALPGPHYVGPFDAGTVNNVYWPNIRKCQYPWVTIVGAGQFNEAREFARNVQNDPIRTNVIFRHWKSVLGSFSDNGRLNDLSAPAWMEYVGSQHINAPYWVMADNEGLGAMVVKNTAALIPLASGVKLKLAVGAWSSHNPARADWPLYMPVFEALYDHPEHVYAPHIYYSRPPKSVENLDGFKLVADHLAHVEKIMTAPIPFPVVITEVGRLANPDGKWLDPDKGYQLEGISETDYADELVRLASPYRAKWSFVVFSRGAWGTRGSLGVGKDYETRMEQYASGEVPMPEAPASPAEMVVRLLHNANGLKLRSERTPASTDLHELKPGETIGYELPTQPGASVQGNDQWLHVYYPPKALWGWVSAYYIEIPPFETPPDTPPEPKPEPEPPAPPEPNEVPATKDDLDKLRTELMAYHNEKYAAYEKRIAALEQALHDVIAAYGKGHVEATKIVEVYKQAS